jgi:hypothetical protein
MLAASLMELGNDEVYYWTYALYPDWSHFDHPPMVGWLIQLSTLDLRLTHELFVRLGAIACSGLSTWLMFRIATRLAGPRAGLIAAVLHTATIYGSVLAGIVILPDAPLVVFWLVTLALLLEALPARTIGARERRLVLAAGASIGLAMLSKYHGIFLAGGALAYVAAYDRRWVREPAVYGAAALAALLSLPILIWNINNDFISFTYHGGRATPALRLRPDLFLTEIGGQVAYQNPIGWVLMLMALSALSRGRLDLDGARTRILVLMGLPLWVTFTGISLFRGTLPHWTGPAYLSLILLTAVHGATRPRRGRPSEPSVGHAAPFIPRRFWAPLALLAPLIVAAAITIQFAPAAFGRDEPETRRGEGDATMDMFGWRQVRAGVETVLRRDQDAGVMSSDAAILSFRWFPAAHIDYYVGTPLGRRVLVAGRLDQAHKYYWINRARGGLTVGDDAYHVAVSNWFEEPEVAFGRLFATIEEPDTIQVWRSGVHVRNALVYRMRGYNGEPLVPDVGGSASRGGSALVPVGTPP